MSNFTYRTGLYPLEKANEVAKEMQDTEGCGWTYSVVDLNNGKGRIDVYDQDNELIAKGFFLG